MLNTMLDLDWVQEQMVSETPVPYLKQIFVHIRDSRLLVLYLKGNEYFCIVHVTLLTAFPGHRWEIVNINAQKIRAKDTTLRDSTD